MFRCLDRIIGHYWKYLLFIMKSSYFCMSRKPSMYSKVQNHNNVTSELIYFIENPAVSHSLRTRTLYRVRVGSYQGGSEVMQGSQGKSQKHLLHYTFDFKLILWDEEWGRMLDDEINFEQVGKMVIHFLIFRFIRHSNRDMHICTYSFKVKIFFYTRWLLSSILLSFLLIVLFCWINIFLSTRKE